jgi:glutathione S-transferase
MITENIAILSWIAEQSPTLRPEGPLGWFRLLEALAYISTEVHKSFPYLLHPGRHRGRQGEGPRPGHASTGIPRRRLGATTTLLGPKLTVADPYLFVIMSWAKPNGVILPPPLAAYFERMKARPTVRPALAIEGLQI